MAEISLVARSGEGKHYAIGATSFELRIRSEDLNGGFSLLEFKGPEGPWTVPHIHHSGRESFYVLEGGFTFRIGDGERDAGPGDFVSVGAGTVHMIKAAAGGGRLLAFVPAGLEAMFIEMSELGPDALTDPVVRKGLAARHDSIPV